MVRVSYQVLNLTHRDGHEAPKPLQPGRYETVRLKLSACGHRFAAGHRLRVSVATAYWPIIWPAPCAATLTIDSAASQLHLPVRPGGDTHAGFAPPAHGLDVPVTMIRPARLERSVTTDFLTGNVTYVTDGQGGLFGEGILRFDEIGTTLSHSLRRELTIHTDDPATAAYTLRQSYEMGREGWETVIALDSEMTSDRENFYLKAQMTVQHNGEHVTTRDWAEIVPRCLI